MWGIQNDLVVHVTAVVDEQPSHLNVAIFGRPVQRRPAKLVLQVRQGRRLAMSRRRWELEEGMY